MNAALTKATEGREKSIRATRQIISSFMEQCDGHIFDPDANSVRFRATLADCLVIENDVSVASCAQSNDENLQKRAVKCFRNDLFDCTGYYFHLRRCNERVDGPRFRLTCSRSNERRTRERDPSSVQRHTTAKEFVDCHGELHIGFSKSNRSATIIYDHKCHAETPKFRITEEIQQYIKAQQLFPPRQIYENLIQLADSPQFAKTDLHTITRQQVYDLLLGEHSAFQLIEGLQGPGVSLAFTTPYSTFGTNRHGYELYCVLTEYDLVSLPLSYLLLDTRGVQEVGKRGSRLTTWLMALRDAGLKPTVVHTDKDFAEVTAAAIAFKRDNPAYRHHLCLRHSLRAVDQHLTGKQSSKGLDSIENARSSIRLSALPHYLRFLSEDSDWILSKGHTKLCTSEQAGNIRSMIKTRLLRHPILSKVVYDNTTVPRSLIFETYEDIHASSVREMFDYCQSICQPKYRPEYRGIQDYASRFLKPRLDVLCYIIITGLLQVQSGREKPSSYKDFVQLWRQCAAAVGDSTILKRVDIYHTDKDKWVYICKHLVSFYSTPHADENGSGLVLERRVTWR
ncbi:hypothetical protein V1506DRAFT_556362 [Lipomyces tetrasporus]